MLKKVLFIITALWMSMGLALADVDLNKADQSQLDSVKGIGPKIAKTIVDERNKNGSFKDWDDFEKRVKGIGDKNSAKMSEAGLTVNGQSKPGTSAKSSGKTTSSTASTSDDKSSNKAADKSATDSKSHGGSRKSVQGNTGASAATAK